jgi:TLC domain
VAIDLAKFFPPEAGTNYDFLVQAICGPLFALTFIVYRVILWWTVGYRMFSDIFCVLRNGSANKERPGRNHVLYVMMILNLLLGALQLYWFTIILGEAVEFLGHRVGSPEGQEL